MEDEEIAYQQVRRHARAILLYIERPEDAKKVALWLSELEPYPEWLLRLEEVK